VLIGDLVTTRQWDKDHHHFSVDHRHRLHPIAGSKSEDNPHVFRRFPTLEIVNTLFLHHMSHRDEWGNVEQFRISISGENRWLR